MNFTFLETIKKPFSNELLEKNADFFGEFFYYKRNISQFMISFKIFAKEEKVNTIIFFLNLYPMSDLFLKEIFKSEQLDFTNPITTDAINYFCNSFIQDIGELGIDFDLETNSLFKKIFEIRDIIDFNQAKIDKLYVTKKDYFQLKEKDESLAKDIKELESGNINQLREEVFTKQKKYDEIKLEQGQMKKQLDKLNNDLSELNKYLELKEKVSICRNLIKEMNLTKDYADKL